MEQHLQNEARPRHIKSVLLDRQGVSIVSLKGVTAQKLALHVLDCASLLADTPLGHLQN